MNKASDYNVKKYSCAESIIKAYNDEFDVNFPVQIGTAMGGGAGDGSLCGAVNASIVIIGLLKGRTSLDEENNAKKYSKELLTKIKEKYGSELCSELKKDRDNCHDIIDFTYNTLKELLKGDEENVSPKAEKINTPNKSKDVLDFSFDK